VEDSANFISFRAEIECSACHYHLPMMLQPVHMEIPILCPSCGHNLTYVIRSAIRKHLNEAVPV
tara:strand:- start:256163 stop:256354 length:192 start_codon:yes stop_codon:yes gene_type:complete